MTTLNKCFRIPGSVIPVTIRDDGTVNIGATGNISIETFASLAWSVLAESNSLNGTWIGFPAKGELHNWPKSPEGYVYNGGTNAG